MTLLLLFQDVPLDNRRRPFLQETRDIKNLHDNSKILS